MKTGDLNTFQTGDGGDFVVPDKFLSELREDARLVAGDRSYDRMWRARVESRQTRLCEWSGQSSDNRKWASNQNDEDVTPFDGASDLRVRYADMVGNEKMMLCVLSMIRGAVRVKPAEGSDVDIAGNLELVRRYLIGTALGWEWFREFIKLGNIVFGETPGVGKMRVIWVRRYSLKYETLDLEKLSMLWVGLQEGVEDEAEVLEQAQGFVEAFMDPDQDSLALVDLIQEFFPFVNRRRGHKIVHELRTTGAARFPAPYVSYEGPEVRAQSYLSEWVVSTGAGEFQRCDRFYEWEWLTEAEVRARRVTDGWSEDFVNDLLKRGSNGAGDRLHDGRVLFKEYGTDDHGNVVSFESARYRGLYQVIHAYVKFTNDDNIPGRYMVTFHPEVDKAATEMRLLDYAHDKWPGHVFQREVLSDRLLDSRGIPELASGTQNLLKLHADGIGDHGQISSLPMLRAPRRWEGDDVDVGPLALLENNGPGGSEWSWLQPPQHPTTVSYMIDQVQKMGDEYFGRAAESVSPDVKRLHDEFTVFWWLTNVSEVMRQVLQLAQQYMPDEMIQRVTNREGLSVLRSREEIQGQFDLNVTFDPRMLDPDFLEKSGGFIQGILLAIDRDKTMQTTPLVESLLWQFSPELADRSLRDVDTAVKSEVEDERKNWQMIISGEEPEMIDDGSQGYDVRRQFYDYLEENNPEIFNSLSEDRRLLLEARVDHLNAMLEQYGNNAQIGRQGAVSGSQRIQEGGASSEEGGR